MSLLFPEPQRARMGPLGAVEPAVRWFTESTRPEAVASRRTVNEWYKTFPDSGSKLAASLASERNDTHRQALDELYVHHLLRQRFGDVRYEEGGIGPDFRIYADGSCVAGVEVLSLFQRADWTAEELGYWRLADELNARVRPTAGYFVIFEIELADRQPAPKRFADFVARQLAELPPQDQIRLPSALTRDDLPSAVFEQEGVRVRIWFWPMTADATTKADPDGRIVGMGPVMGGTVNSEVRLKDRIEAKAGGRYDIADVPFLIVAAVHDPLCSDNQVLSALYGGESVVLSTNEMTRRNDGLFGVDRTQSQGRHRRVSAVAVIRQIRVWEPDRADVAVLHNPYPAHAWPAEVLPGSRFFGALSERDGMMEWGWSSRLETS